MASAAVPSVDVPGTWHYAAALQRPWDAVCVFGSSGHRLYKFIHRAEHTQEYFVNSGVVGNSTAATPSKPFFGGAARPSGVTPNQAAVGSVAPLPPALATCARMPAGGGAVRAPLGDGAVVAAAVGPHPSPVKPCRWHQQVQGPLTLVTLPTHISFSRPLLWRAITMHSAATSWVQQGAQRSTSVAPSGAAGPACRQQSVIINHTERISFRLKSRPPAPSSGSHWTRFLHRSSGAGGCQQSNTSCALPPRAARFSHTHGCSMQPLHCTLASACGPSHPQHVGSFRQPPESVGPTTTCSLKGICTQGVRTATSAHTTGNGSWCHLQVPGQAAASLRQHSDPCSAQHTRTLEAISFFANLYSWLCKGADHASAGSSAHSARLSKH